MMTTQEKQTMKITRHFRSGLAQAFISLAALACLFTLPAGMMVAPGSAEAVVTLSTTARNAELNGLVTTLGGSATATFYSGSKPAALGNTGSCTPTACTSLAVITFGSAAVTDANGGSAGGVSGGVLTFGGFTQSAGTFTAGTPTFVRFKTSGGTVVADIDIGSGAGNIPFSGAIANGQNITGTLTITAGNP